MLLILEVSRINFLILCTYLYKKVKYFTRFIHCEYLRLATQFTLTGPHIIKIVRFIYSSS